MATIQEAIEYAKKNPNSSFATELRKRIESGQMDSELKSAGLPLPSQIGTQAPQMDATRANEFLAKPAVEQIFTKEFIKEVPKAAYQTLIGNALKFIKSAVEVPKNIVQSLQGKPITTTEGKDPVTGQPITSFQSDFQNKTLPAVESGQVSPLKATAETVGNVALAGLDVLGAEALVKGSIKTVQSIADKIKQISAPEVKLAETIKKDSKIVSDFYQDVKPKSADLRDRAIAKALRLAPSEDLGTFKQLTGEDMGQFLSRNNLIKDTPGETAEAIKTFQRENFDLTRDAIALVDERYTFKALPEIEHIVDRLLVDLQGRKSNEFVQVFNKLSEIKKRGDFDLLDAQYVKEAFDDLESVYKRTGEVKDAVGSEDLAQLVKPVRRFIEDRVREQYPQIDIRGLNKNVQASRAILDSIVKRAPKADTSSIFQLGDFATIGLGNQIVPGAGFPALFAKKVLESSPVRLRFARAMAKLAQKQALAKGEITKGLTPENITEMKKLITDELKDAMKQGDNTLINSLKKIQSEI